MGNGIIFRCDFGGTRGWGHVVRCSSLALAARAQGLKTGLVSQASLSDLPEEVQRAFDHYYPVSSQIPTNNFWERLCAPDGPWGCVVVDQYDYARREFALLKQALVLSGSVLVVLDDEAKRDLGAADLVVNHVLGATAALYPKGTELLAGSDYAMLRPGFTESPEPDPEMAGLRSPVSVMFGGTDPRNLSGMSLRLLGDAGADKYSPVLIRTRQVAFKDEIEKEFRKFDRSLWIEQVSSDRMSRIFHQATFAVTACGGSVYEVAACRLPFIGVIVAPNQLRMAKAIEENWGMPVLPAENLNRRNFLAAHEKLLQKLPARGKKREDYSGIDGKGPERIVAAIRERQKTLA